MADQDKEAKRRKIPKLVLTILICLAILTGAVVATWMIFLTEPEAQRIAATRQSAMLVNVVEAKIDTYQPKLTVLGTVRPAQDIMISPRVSGEILDRTKAFTPGGFVKKGEMLLQIDPADYENVLRQRKSDERQAVADLELEMGRQNVAQQEFDLLADDLNETNEALMLRQPQLNTARAQLEASRAALNQAELDLQRTKILAPFDAQVVERMVNIGSQVSPGTELGRLVGTDTYWIEATVPLARLPWVAFPDEENPQGAPVKVRSPTAWPDGFEREGRMYQLIGTLEERTRLARVLITVEDPLLLQSSQPQQERHPLIIGSFVEAEIQLIPLSDVIRLRREQLHRDNTVWVMEEGKLAIRKVNVRFQDAEHAYIDSGLDDGAMVVTTNLATVVEGALLRVEEDGEAAVDNTATEEGNAGGTS